MFKVTIKTPEQCQWRRFGVFIVSFEPFSYIVLVIPLLALNNLILAGKVPLSMLYIQPAITCSKLKIETLEQGAKYVQS